MQQKQKLIEWQLAIMATLNVTAMFLELNRGEIAYAVLFGEYVKLKEYEKSRELKQKEGVRKKEEGTCESHYRPRREKDLQRAVTSKEISQEAQDRKIIRYPH
jgi:hypothetical protein